MPGRAVLFHLLPLDLAAAMTVLCRKQTAAPVHDGAATVTVYYSLYRSLRDVTAYKQQQ